jgi:hypothetical protein
VRYRFAKNPEKELKGIDYGIDSNPDFSIMFILFNLAVYSNPLSLYRNLKEILLPEMRAARLAPSQFIIRLHWT